MTQKRKIYLLWGIRIFALAVVVTPIADSLIPSPLCYILVAAALIIALLVAYFIIRNISVTVKANEVKYTAGSMFRTEITVKLAHVSSTRKFTTPLTKAMKLTNYVLYTDYAYYLLPTLSKEKTAELENALRLQ
ncbi:MAG: hypothetical protein ACI4GZ_03650 [Ruminococcus sp.]